MGVVTEEAQEYMVPITVPARNSGKSHSSQQWKIRHIHGGVGKAVSIHSTPLPLSSIKIHLSKGGPDRSILIDESSKLRYEHHEYTLFSVVASCDFSAVASRYCIQHGGVVTNDNEYTNTRIY